MDKLTIWKPKLNYWEGELIKATSETRRQHVKKQIERLKKKIANPQHYSGY